MTFNPQDNTHLCVVGQGLFKLYRYMEGTLKALLFQKYDSSQNYLSHAWLGGERMLAGTQNGAVLLFENNELKAEFDNLGLPGQACEALMPYSRGFVAAVGNHVVVFEKSDDSGLYRRVSTEALPAVAAATQTIKALAVNPSNTTVLCTTHLSQLFSLPLTETDGDEPMAGGTGSGSARATATLLAQAFHHGEITGMDICIRKTIVATCSRDHSLRIWSVAPLPHCFNLCPHPSVPPY